MIRNIVFDLGNVLLTFRPSEYLEANNYPEERRRLILSDVFGSSQWQRLDDGSLTVSEAIELIATESKLRRQEIEQIFVKRTEMLLPINNNIKLLPELKKEGFRLYFLSNFPLDIFDEVRNTFDFFQNFDGGLISARAGFVKPDSRIYKKLVDMYSIIPEESLFIDDLEANVKAAVSFGMKGLFTGGSEDIGKMLRNYLIK